MALACHIPTLILVFKMISCRCPQSCSICYNPCTTPESVEAAALRRDVSRQPEKSLASKAAAWQPCLACIARYHTPECFKVVTILQLLHKFFKQALSISRLIISMSPVRSNSRNMFLKWP